MKEKTLRQKSIYPFPIPPLLYFSIIRDRAIVEVIRKEFPEEKDIINVFCFLFGLRTYMNYSHKALKKEEDSYIRIHSDVIKRSMTVENRPKPLLDKLIKIKIIERNDSFCVNNYSKGYRFHEKIRNEKWDRIDFQEFLAEFAPKVGHKKAYQGIHSKFCSSLNCWQNMSEGWIRDVCRLTEALGEKIRVEVPEDINKTILEVAREKYEIYLQKKIKEKNPLKLNDFVSYYSLNLNRLEEKDFPVHCWENGFSHRLYTLITTLPRRFRKYLRFQGRELHNLDMRCSQLSLLAVFYEDFSEDKKEKDKFVNIILDPDDDFYSMFARESGVSRDVAKTETFKVMFARNEQQRGAIYKSFKKFLPILTEKIENFKKIYGYTAVSRKMQQTEAEIVVQKTLLPLLQSGIPVFSIHDSLMGMTQDLPQIETMLKKSFFEQMGFYPFIRPD